MAIFSFLLRFMQIMEDVWLSAELDRFWSHPLNEGWMSYFHRWASTPSFRRWWPILSPIYGLGFREFAKERFGVGVQDQAARPSNERAIAAGQLALNLVTDQEKFMATHTWKVFQQRHPNFQIPTDARLFGYELELLGYDGKLSGQKLVVGFVIVHEHRLKPHESERCRCGAGSGKMGGLLAFHRIIHAARAARQRHDRAHAGCRDQDLRKRRPH